MDSEKRIDPYQLTDADREDYINVRITSMKEANPGADETYIREMAERIWDLRVKWYNEQP